ncbi:MAG TPA: hypothetical protein PLU50_12030, partial [Pseudobdellovibrionaceae bacterium]|nr:hypothetical protein [Pseudobdellovibrionaceae bacterium]
TASGAALLAAHQCGLMSLENIESSWKLKRTYKPSVLSEHRARLYQGWLKAVEQLIGHRS